MAVGALNAQVAYLQSAPRVQLPTHIDGNSPSFWDENGFNLFSSTGNPEMISVGANQFGPWNSSNVDVSRQLHVPLWVEAAWRDEDGVIFGWYHHEPDQASICGNKGLTAPKIGAVVSYDGGRTIEDLGIVLESGDAVNCNAKNGFFAGGHGDFSVVLDREGKYFYFFFTNYGGRTEEQGVVTARLAFEDRYHPAGAVQKFYQGEWNEPGIGGHMTPVFRANRDWSREDTDSFWGPSVHWNTHLETYVVLLNRACCKPEWPQDGIHISFNADLANPSYWRTPVMLLTGSLIGFRPGFYPQVIGLEENGTDTLAGERARFYVHGISNWEIVFVKDQPIDPEPPTPPVNGLVQN